MTNNVVQNIGGMVTGDDDRPTQGRLQGGGWCEQRPGVPVQIPIEHIGRFAERLADREAPIVHQHRDQIVWIAVLALLGEGVDVVDPGTQERRQLAQRVSFGTRSSDEPIAKIDQAFTAFMRSPAARLPPPGLEPGCLFGPRF
jgi:hypothetical protein